MTTSPSRDEPLGDRPFGHALAELGHGDVDKHRGLFTLAPCHWQRVPSALNIGWPKYVGRLRPRFQSRPASPTGAWRGSAGRIRARLATKYPSVPCTCGRRRKSWPRHPPRATSPLPVERRGGEVGPLGEERGDDLLAFLAQHAADGVDEATAGAHVAATRDRMARWRTREARSRSASAPSAPGGPAAGGACLCPSRGRRRARDRTNPAPPRTRPPSRPRRRARTARPMRAELAPRRSSFGGGVRRVDRSGRHRLRAASAPVLFPRPAHASSTVSPGRAPSASATSCEPSSCTRPRPLGEARERCGLPAPRTRIAAGDDAPGLERRVRRRGAKARDPRVPRVGASSTRSPTGGGSRRRSRGTRSTASVAERPREGVPQPGRRRRDDRLVEPRRPRGRAVARPFARGLARRACGGPRWRTPATRAPRAAPHRLHRLVHGRERGHAREEEELVGRELEVRAHARRRAHRFPAWRAARSARRATGETRSVP